MELIILDLIKQNGINVLVVMFGIWQLRNMFKDIKEKIDENTKAIVSLDHSVTKLEIHVETLNKKIVKVDKLDKDINKAFTEIKDIKGRLSAK